MSWLTLIGTIASLGGAVISIWQASLSKNAAKEALRIRGQLIDKRKTSELAKLLASCQKALRSMDKYGPGSTASSILGVTPNRDADDVREFLLLLNENRDYFGSKIPNEADEFSANLYQPLDNFVQSTLPQEMLNYGKNIVIELSRMAARIKRLLDNKREKMG